MKIVYIGIIAILGLSLASCDRGLSSSTPAMQVRVQVKDVAHMEKYRKVLLARLTEATPSLFSKVQISQDQDNLVVEFYGSVPKPSTIEYLVNQRGQLTGRDETGFILYSSADIREASMIIDQSGKPALAVRLSDEKGNLLARFTHDNLGKFLSMELDGKLLSKVRILGEISSRFMVSFADSYSADEIRLMAILISHGELPAEAKVIN